MFRLAVQPRRAAFMTATALVAGGSYLYLQKQTQLDTSDAPVTKRRPGPLWAPMSRDQMLAHLRTSGTFINRTAHGGPDPAAFVPKNAKAKEDDDVFDLLIVGGGATGAGTAVDAASRGLKVAMVERDDFSSGTSSKSTKLVHGGVRYLQKAVMELDYEQYKLVKEALRERRIFLETAPHLSHMLPILLPLYAWWQLPYYYAGCKMYDILAGKENMESSYWMTKSRALEAFLAEAGETGRVTVSSRIGRWAPGDPAMTGGSGVYSVVPNEAPAVAARPVVSTAPAAFDQFDFGGS